MLSCWLHRLVNNNTATVFFLSLDERVEEVFQIKEIPNVLVVLFDRCHGLGLQFSKAIDEHGRESRMASQHGDESKGASR